MQCITLVNYIIHHRRIEIYNNLIIITNSTSGVKSIYASHVTFIHPKI